MPIKRAAKYPALYPKQLQFIRRLALGDATAEQVLQEMKITETVFGQWLKKEAFLRRYERALNQVKARAASAEAIARLHRARKKLADQPSESTDLPAPQLPPGVSPMARRLLELHGTPQAVEERLAESKREINDDAVCSAG